MMRPRIQISDTEARGGRRRREEEEEEEEEEGALACLAMLSNWLLSCPEDRRTRIPPRAPEK